MYNLNTISLLNSYIKLIFPKVYDELEIWKVKASCCPDNTLFTQAMSSIDKKGFHALGGSVFALYPGADCDNLVKLIVAYQTISDYLDNLCDRAGVLDEDSFSQLHIATVDALEVEGSFHDYYKYYHYKDDGGYLIALVEECKHQISKLPAYELVAKDIMNFANLYSGLQTYKHLSFDTREKKLFQWSKTNMGTLKGLFPWEFCAATGSTLGIFVLFAAASNPILKPQDVLEIKEAYFPWLCGLHILLDYFIDYNEDIENKDLNFVQYYNESIEVSNRLNFFIENSLKKVSTLKYPLFHKTVVYGLLAMYLSDEKAYSSNLKDTSKRIISSQNIKAKLMHGLCKKLRQKSII